MTPRRPRASSKTPSATQRSAPPSRDSAPALIALVLAALVLATLVLAPSCTSPAAPTDAGPDTRTPDAPTRDAPLPPPTCPGPFAPPTDAELAIRRRLGIPDEAGCAVVLAQTSHLDVDWRVSFDEYYGSYVEDILTDAHDLLAADPDYRYQLCEMSFLAEHVRRHPEHATALRDAAGRGALRIVGGGITSPDTLLPTTEALVRDYLRGSLVAEELLGVTPRAAWLPDSFGHSPTTPDLLAGMGYESVAFARVDGLHDGFEAEHGQPRVVPGSTAALLSDLGSADFVWVGPGGGEVLAHWMPIRIYCQGDDIDHTGTPSPGGYILGRDMSADADYTNGRIATYVRELLPFVRTPYLFVPIGCDFEPPRPALLAVIDRWNATMYPRTGIWAVASNFEDYTDLLADRHADLPRMERDIAPYFSGYFGSRLALKTGTREAGDLLSQAEIAALLAETIAGTPYPRAELDAAWDLFARTNHHDFVTGTSLDRVVMDEQMPLLAALTGTAEASIAASMTSLAAALTDDATAVASVAVLGTVGATGGRSATLDVTLPPGAARALGADVPSQVLSETRHPDGSIATASVLLVVPDVAPASVVVVPLRSVAGTGPVSLVETMADVTLRDTSAGLVARVDRATGRLTALEVDGVAFVDAPSLGVDDWADEGGLYRIGSETTSCVFERAGPVGGAATLTIVERGPARAVVRIDRGAVLVTLSIVAGTGRLDVEVEASAAEGRALTVGLASTATGATARFVHGAGFVTRPESRLYTPTFWPVVRALDLSRPDGSGIALLPRASTGVRWGSAGSLDIMVSRDARAEMCDQLGAAGSELVHRAFAFSILPHRVAIDAHAEALALLAAPALQLTGAGAAAAGALFSLRGSGWVLSAAKPADRGAGTIVRVERTSAAGTLVVGPGLRSAGTITRTDLLERGDLTATATIPLDAPLVTLRVEP